MHLCCVARGTYIKRRWPFVEMLSWNLYPGKARQGEMEGGGREEGGREGGIYLQVLGIQFISRVKSIVETCAAHDLQ